MSKKDWEQKGFIKGFWKCTKFLIILSVITIGIQLLYDKAFHWEAVKGWLIANVYFGFTFYFANAYLNEGINKIYPWEEKPKLRALVGIPAFLVMNTVLLAFLIYGFQLFIKKVENPQFFSSNHLDTYLISLTICLVATLYFHAAGFYQGMMKQMKINEKLTEEKVSVELNALKSQVNPHFLFNSFNVLSGLIDEDPDKAQEFLGGLSKIYRYILEQRNEHLTSLEQELAFAKQYLKLQETRFTDSVKVKIYVPEKFMEKKIPSLSLQLLLENAIKHNAFDKQEPLNISIVKTDLGLEVTNNVKKRSHINESNGIGLENISERYKLYKVDGFSYIEENQLFKVVLPLI